MSGERQAFFSIRLLVAPLATTFVALAESVLHSLPLHVQGIALMRATAMAGIGVALLAALVLMSSDDPVGAAPGVSDPVPGHLFQVAIDTDTTGNPQGSGGLLSPIDPCLEVSGTGTTFDVDIVIDELHPANPIIGFDVVLSFDPAVIDVVGHDMTSFILPTDGPDVSFVMDYVVPDSPAGEWAYGAIVFGVSGEPGEGVMVRVTFETVGPGTTSIGLAGMGLPTPNVLYLPVWPAGSSGGPITAERVGDGYVAVDTLIGAECADDDGDGAVNVIDNCPSLSNPSQGDWDINGIGDACDTVDDADGDGIFDSIDGTWGGSFTDLSNTPSTSFTDQHLGGVSYGDIVSQGAVDVRVKDIESGGFLVGGLGPTSGLENATIIEMCGETQIRVWGERAASVGCTNSTVLNVFEDEMDIEAGNLTATLPRGAEVVVENAGPGYTIENTANSGAVITVNGSPLMPGNTDHDLDFDGFLASNEALIGTDPNDPCGAGAWPPDFDDNQVINSTDVFKVLPPFLGTSVPPTSARQDLNPDGVINTTDVFKVLPPFLGSSCTP